VANFTFKLLYSQGKHSHCLWSRSLVGSQSHSGNCQEKRNTLCPHRDLNFWLWSPPSSCSYPNPWWMVHKMWFLDPSVIVSVCATCPANVFLHDLLLNIGRWIMKIVKFSVTYFPLCCQLCIKHFPSPRLTTQVLQTGGIECGDVLQGSWICQSQCTCACYRLCTSDWQAHGFTVHTTGHIGNILVFRCLLCLCVCLSVF
jgi:hypothetical protein